MNEGQKTFSKEKNITTAPALRKDIENIIKKSISKEEEETMQDFIALGRRNWLNSLKTQNSTSHSTIPSLYYSVQIPKIWKNRFSL